MKVRWRKILKFTLPLVAITLLPVVSNRLLFRFDEATCVREYPDGTVEKDFDEGCVDPAKPKPLATFRVKDTAQ